MIRGMLKPLWAYRGFIAGSVKREFQVKYRNSLLGALWNILNPMAMIVVYTVIFSQIMQARIPGVDSTFAYSIYLCAGILSWGLFAEIVSRSQNVFLENANLLKKISFPRMSLPCIVVLSAGMNFAIISGLFLGFLLLTGNFPGWTVLGAVPVLLVQVAFSVGLGIILGVFNVFFRDVGQFFGVFLQFWFWMTPIVYMESILPAGLQSVLRWNPMARIVGAYQTIFVQASWPDWSTLLLPTVLGIFFCAIGFRLFRKHSGEIVDEI